MERQAPLFKGATRPACVWGIPIKPFCGCVAIWLLLAFWLYIPLLLGAIPSIFVMHKIAKEDDQRFHQLFLLLRVNLMGSGNKQHWGTVTSFAPVSYKKEKIKEK